MPESRRGTVADPRIDAALKSYPLTPLPPGFLERATSRIEAEARAGRARPPVGRQGLAAAYLELILAACASSTLAAALVVLAWGLRRADPLWLAELALALRASALRLAGLLALPSGGLLMLLAAGAGLTGALVLLASDRGRTVLAGR